jgi:hypothetical protein
LSAAYSVVSAFISTLHLRVRRVSGCQIINKMLKTLRGDGEVLMVTVDKRGVCELYYSGSVQECNEWPGVLADGQSIYQPGLSITDLAAARSGSVDCLCLVLRRHAGLAMYIC